MKFKYLIIVVLAFIFTSCLSSLPTTSRFVAQSPNIGMNIKEFVAFYGAPLNYSKFYDEANDYCEELRYRERIHLGQGFYGSEIRAINTVFLFKNGKLVSQYQEDDLEYQRQLERDEERALIRKQIQTEKERIETEKERLEMERERLKKKEDKSF